MFGLVIHDPTPHDGLDIHYPTPIHLFGLDKHESIPIYGFGLVIHEKTSIHGLVIHYPTPIDG